MDQSVVDVKTYVLKANIHCTGCEKKLKKLLQNISGVHRVSIDAEQGKITVSGTIDPLTVSKLVGKKSDFLLEPVMDQNKDLQIVSKQKSAPNYHGLNDRDVVAQLQKLSEFKGLKYVELTRDKMKLTFKGDDDDDFSCENGTCSARNSAMHKECCRVMNNDCDFEVKHESWCARNPHKQYCICNGCRLPLPTTCSCKCMASQGSTIPASGIPWPGYINNTPSAPPEYYPPPPAPSPYNDPFYTTFSDDNTKGCTVM